MLEFSSLSAECFDAVPNMEPGLAKSDAEAKEEPAEVAGKNAKGSEIAVEDDADWEVMVVLVDCVGPKSREISSDAVDLVADGARADSNDVNDAEVDTDEDELLLARKESNGEMEELNSESTEEVDAAELLENNRGGGMSAGRSADETRLVSVS